MRFTPGGEPYDEADIGDVTPTAMAFAPDGRAWVATESPGKVLVIDADGRASESQPWLAGSWLAVDGRGQVWLKALNDTRIQVNAADGLPLAEIELPGNVANPPMAVASDGTFWLLVDPGDLIHYAPPTR